MWEYREIIDNQILFVQSFYDSNIEWILTLKINEDGINTYVLNKVLHKFLYDRIEVRTVKTYSGLISNFKSDIIKISKLLSNKILPNNSLNLKKKIEDYSTVSLIDLEIINDTEWKMV